MKHLLILFSIAALALFACTGGEDNVKIPSDILSPDSMVSLLVDVHLVEAAIQQKHQQGKEAANFSGYYYSGIMKKHHINRTGFNRYIEFYSYHPKLLREIYDKVIIELSTLQSIQGRRLPRESE